MTITPSPPAVAGFMFDPSFRNVVLIRKLKPAWQRGKLNGVGGKVEPGESTAAAMPREFHEETGVSTREQDWLYFCSQYGGEENPWDVHFFACIGDPATLARAGTTERDEREKEMIEITAVADVLNGRGKVNADLRWLIPLAIELLGSQPPGFASVAYGSRTGVAPFSHASTWGAWARIPFDPEQPECVRCTRSLALRDGCEWNDVPELNLCLDCAIKTLGESRSNFSPAPTTTITARHP